MKKTSIANQGNHLFERFKRAPDRLATAAHTGNRVAEARHV
ncbi:MAG: hypothetical protein ABI212_07335 [Burkholderiaceae bacterium]